MPANVQPFSFGRSSNMVSESQVLEESRVRRRMKLLEEHTPNFAYGNAVDALNLAQSDLDDDQMMSAVTDAMGAVGMKKMLNSMQSLSEQDQFEQWEAMPPQLRAALEQAGWEKPSVDEGMFDFVGDAASAAMRGIGKGVSTVGKFTISPVLKGMTWISEEAGRAQRVNPIQSSRARLLNETGMTTEQLMTQTGIDTRFANNRERQGPLEDLIGGFQSMVTGPVLAGMARNKNPFTWWQAWDSIGHSGKDDYLAETQYEVFNRLQSDYGGNAKDILRYAKELTSGTSIDDLVEDEGKTGIEAEQFRLLINQLQADKPFQKAMSDLAAGRVSFGRNVTRALTFDPTKDLSGAWGLPSGALDAFYQVAGDPTLVVGKLSKSIRATKWVVSSANDIHRFRGLALAQELVNNGASDEAVDKALQGLSGNGWRRVIPTMRRSALLEEAKSVSAPAEAVTRAFKTGDFATLQRMYPGFSPSIYDMKAFHANRVGQNMYGLDTIDGVFDFYLYAQGNRNWINAADVALSASRPVASTRLFGTNGTGALYIPKSSFSERLALEARTKIGNWVYMRDAVPAGLKETDDALVAREIAEAGGEEVQSLVDEVGGVADEAADEMEIDEDTLAYAGKKTEEQSRTLFDMMGGSKAVELYKNRDTAFVRRQIRNVARGLTTSAPTRTGLGIADVYKAGPEEFSRFNKSLGMLKGDPAELIDVRFNRFVNGGVNERYMLVTEMLDNLATVAGFSGNKEGRDVIRKMIEHNNKVFGFQDDFGVRINGNMTVVRHAIDETQLSNLIQLPDFKEMMLATRHANTVRRVAGRVRKSELDALAVKFWKPAVIARWGFAVRNGAEEALQFVGRVGANDYLNQAVFAKWAGIKEKDGVLAVDRAGEIVKAPQGAYNFGRWMTRSFASAMNVTEQALQRRALETAMQAPNWQALSDEARDAAVKLAYDEVTDGLGAIPRSARWIDKAAHNFAANSAQVWHSTALGRRVNRAALGELILKNQFGDIMRRERGATYRSIMENTRDFFMLPGPRQAASEQIGHAMAGVMPDDMARRALKDSGLLRTADSRTHYQHIPVRTVSDEWRWYEQSATADLSGYGAALAGRLNSFADSEMARPAMYEFTHFVRPADVDKINELFVNVALDDETGIELVRRLRDEIPEGWFKYLEWNKPDLDSWLESSYLTSLRNTIENGLGLPSSDKPLKAWMDEDYEDLLARATAEGVKLPAEPWHRSELGQALVAGWDELTPQMRNVLFNPHLSSWKLTADVEELRSMAQMAVNNAAYQFKNAPAQYQMVRAYIVDGKPVLEPVAENHTRILAPMVDRNAIEDLLRVFQANTPNSMTMEFRDRLLANMRANGVGQYLDDAWTAAWPRTSGPVDDDALTTWLSSLKATLAQSNAPYIPAMMTGTRNPAMAAALRDTLRDVLPETPLAPTVGYFDVPNWLLRDKDFNLQEVSEQVTRMQPYHSLRLKPLDPDSVVRIQKVRLANGDVRWLADSELEEAVGRKIAYGRSDLQVKTSLKGEMITSRDRAISINSRWIREDYKNGRKFLNGEGGVQQREGKFTYVWDDPEISGDAQVMREFLEELGVFDNYGFEDLDDLLKLMRTRFNRIPKEQEGLADLLTDATWPNSSMTVLERLQNLAKSASKEQLETLDPYVSDFLVDQSKIVRAALDKLEVDQSVIDNMSLKQYRTLLIQREKAHDVLSVRGARRSRSTSTTAVEQEADVLAMAFQRSGIDPGEAAAANMRNRMSLVAKGTEEKATYEILGETYAAGVTQDAAMARMTQQIVDEVEQFVIGQESGEPLTELIQMALRGDLTGTDVLGLAEFKDLPAKAAGPVKALATENTFQRIVNNMFEGSIDPMVGSISRMPQSLDAFGKAKTTFRHVYDGIAQRDLDDGAKAILRDRIGAGWWDDKITDEWDAVNRYVVGDFKDNPNWVPDDGDFLSDLAQMVHNGNVQGANEAVAKHLNLEIPDGSTAAAVLGDSAFTVEDLVVLRAWQLNQSEAYSRWFETSFQRMVEMVSPFIDDHRIRSVASEYFGPLILPFFSAETQFLKRFARGMYETPHMLRKGQLMMNGLRSIGIVQKDDVSGKEVMVVPFSELAGQAVAEVSEHVFGNPAMHMFSQPLTMRTDMMIPGGNTDQSRFGVGPLIGFAMSELTTRFPETEWRADDPNRSRLDFILPSSVTGIYRIATQDPKELMASELSAITMLYASGVTDDNPYGYGLRPDATAAERDEFLSNVRSTSRAISILKLISGFIGPAKMTPLDASAYMRKEFTDLLAEGLSYEDAMQVFIEKNGPGALAYTMYGTKNEVGAPIPNNAKAYDFMLEYGDMIRDDPEAMVWLIPQDESDDKFDRRAYNEAMALGLRSAREPQELIDAFEIKQAAPEYYEMRDQYEAERRALSDSKAAGWQEARKQLDMQWEIKKAAYLKMHPTFAESFSGEASERRKRTLQKLEYRLNAGFGGEQGAELRDLVNLYMQFDRDFSAISGQSYAAQKLKKKTFDNYFTAMWVYTKQKPRVSAFFNSVIRPELPDGMMDTDLAGLGGMSARDVMEV
jgi:hypothetical protein